LQAGLIGPPDYHSPTRTALHLEGFRKIAHVNRQRKIHEAVHVCERLSFRYIAEGIDEGNNLFENKGIIATYFYLHFFEGVTCNNLKIESLIFVQTLPYWISNIEMLPTIESPSDRGFW